MSLIEKSIKKSEILEKAKTMTPEEQCELGIKFMFGEGVKVDKKLALKLFEMSADGGYVGAIHNLGMWYLVHSDKEIATDYFIKAAEYGNTHSMYQLSGIYYDSEPRDYVRAFKYCSQASELGHVKAKLNLGSMYLRGQGVEQNYQKALECYQEASNLGNAKAKFCLGVMYENGYAVEQDLSQALRFYVEAYEQGFIDAIFNIGHLHELGYGSKPEYDTALHHYQTEAKKGNADAIYNLALMYFKGAGVEKDLTISAELYSKAVQMGHDRAKCNYALLLKNGFGVSKDVKQAEELFYEVNEAYWAVIISRYNLGLINQHCLLGQQKTNETIKKAIAFYKECLDLQTNEIVIGSSFINASIAQCYLELYYEALANIDSKKRSKKNILEQQKYKDEAKKYLKLAEDNKHLLDEEELADFEEQIKLYKSILEDNNIELTDISYQDFKEKFFDKHSNIFLLADKHETALYKGIQEYFKKREEDYLQKIIAEAVEERTRQLRYVIKRKYPDLEIAKVDEMVQLRSRQIEEEIKNNTIVDFSGCVLDIDKYLEETLKLVFIDFYKEEMPNIIKVKINENVAKVQENNSKVSTEFLKQIVGILNKNPVPDDYTREKCISRIAEFISFAKTRSKKLYPSIIMENLNDYLQQNESILKNEEKEFIQNMLNSGELKLELFKFEDKDSNSETKEDHFT